MEAASPCPALPSPETIQVPSCNSQLQVRGAELGSCCSKCCPESNHPHLAQPGGWAVNADKKSSFQKRMFKGFM